MISFSFLGTMLLFIACLLEHRDMVEFLIKKGVGVNTSLSKNQFYDYLSPLSVACKTNNMEIIEFLWKNKAEITESIAIQNPEITGTLLERYQLLLFQSASGYVSVMI